MSKQNKQTTKNSIIIALLIVNIVLIILVGNLNYKYHSTRAELQQLEVMYNTTCTAYTELRKDTKALQEIVSNYEDTCSRYQNICEEYRIAIEDFVDTLNTYLFYEYNCTYYDEIPMELEEIER